MTPQEMTDTEARIRQAAHQGAQAAIQEAIWKIPQLLLSNQLILELVRQQLPEAQFRDYLNALMDYGFIVIPPKLFTDTPR